MSRISNDAGNAPLIVAFADNLLFAQLAGEHDRNLARIEQQLDVSLTPRGNRLAITGSPDDCAAARSVLESLYASLEKGMDVGDGEIDGAIRMASAEAPWAGQAPAGAVGEVLIKTRKRHISPRSANQVAYARALQKNELVFGLGPAGTGKTYLAVAVAVEMLISGRVDRIILSRPAVEAGERLGFLPGDMREKIDPYLRPLYDALFDMLPAEQVHKRLESGEIEVAPLAFMRGRTLSNAYVILDEAQNTTTVQMKMLLTRLGENSRMVVTGDLSQIDLPAGVKSGLREASQVLQGTDGIGFVEFAESDVVRHPLVTRIVKAYGLYERGKAERSNTPRRGRSTESARGPAKRGGQGGEKNDD